MTKIIRFLIMFGLFVVASIVFGVVFTAARSDSDIAISVLFVMFVIGLVQAMNFGWRLLMSELNDAGEPSHAKAKPKRITDHSAEDARLSLLLALMTPDERDELKARLADEIDIDEGALPLENLLAERENVSRRY